MPTQVHINGRRDFQAKGVLSFGSFSLPLAERLLKKADDPVPLGGRALDTLIALTERAGEVVSYKELLTIAWPNVTVDETNLRVQIATLWKALGEGEDGARYISNVAGRGYCFVAVIVLSRQSQAPLRRRLRPRGSPTESHIESCRRD